MRAALILAHRYAGLALAGFLFLAGLTGALLAWNDELDSRLNPSLFHARAPAPDAEPLDPLHLRHLVAQAFPDTQVLYAPLTTAPGDAYVFYLQAASGASLANDQVFIDPYTGVILGVRKWGDISQGAKNLMPFIERLHYSLVLGDAGTYVFGIIALLWTLDCFAGAWLTLPPPAVSPPTGRRRSWLARWTPAWKLRWTAGGYKRTFDLHRAGGLWLWFMLFVLAWSGVSFNLPGVYEPVMKALFMHQPGESALPPPGAANPEPPIGWQAARATGRRLMADEARTHGFHTIEETGLQYDPWRTVYTYTVRSTLDVRERNGLTMVMFDANTGARLSAWIPTGAAAGDTLRSWLASLHMATMWGWPFKLFICVVGLMVAVLSVTGVMIWRRKQKGRLRSGHAATSHRHVR